MVNLLASRPAVVVLEDDVQPTKTSIFAAGQDSHLYWLHHNGASWEPWQDLGKPPDTTIPVNFGGAAAITYEEPAATQMVLVFLRGENGHLLLWYSMDGGDTWHWQDQGQPSDTVKITGIPAAVTYRLFPQPRRIYVFARGDDGNLYVNYFDGLVWQWGDHGKPSNTTVSASPGVVTFSEDNGQTHRIYAFVRGGDGQLYVRYRDGSWKWAKQGAPQGATVSSKISAGDSRIPRAVTYPSTGFNLTTRIYAFISTEDDYTAANYWNGSSWTWKKWTNFPPVVQPGMAPVLGDAITFTEGPAQEREVVLYSLYNGNLPGNNRLCYRHGEENPTNWPIEDSNNVLSWAPAVIAYKKNLATEARPWVFVCNDVLKQFSWDGSWITTNHGNP